MTHVSLYHECCQIKLTKIKFAAYCGNLLFCFFFTILKSVLPWVLKVKSTENWQILLFYQNDSKIGKNDLHIFKI